MSERHSFRLFSTFQRLQFLLRNSQGEVIDYAASTSTNWFPISEETLDEVLYRAACHSFTPRKGRSLHLIPGPIIIKKCSSCSNPVEEHTISSGNTFGARFWTDGKMDAPMLPDHSWLVKCPHCNALLWIDEQEKLGEVSLWSRGTKFGSARACKAPSLQDYFSMLEKGVSDHRKEQYVRLRAWRAGNDGRRRTKEKTPLSDSEKANLRRLADLLDEVSDRDRIMKAEVLRELGLFDDALSLLAQPFDDELNWALLIRTVSLIKDLVAKKDQFVAEITSR